MSRRLRRLTPARADALREAVPTFGDPGAVVAGRVPDGFRPLTHRAVIGCGEQDFDLAAGRILAWQLQLRSGLGVRSSTADVEVGAVAVVLIGIGPVGLRAPVRVTEVIDGPDACGFVYVTLPGHPECGEERFLVEREQDGTVVVRIDAVSRPATWPARLGGPVTRLVQRCVTWRYGRSLRA